MQATYDPVRGFRRLRPLFREAICRAKEVIRVLQDPRWNSPSLSGSKDYALGLARLAMAMAEHGLKAPASQANTLAETVELLLDRLHVEMCDLLES